jgi:hypothetical protein
MRENLRLGDVVVLNSGGPAMTVISVDDTSVSKRCCQATSCVCPGGGYCQGISASMRLLGWPLTMRVMVSRR